MGKIRLLSLIIAVAGCLSARGAEDTWVSIGRGTYTDDILTAISNVSVASWPVEIEQSTLTPGLYRAVDVMRPADNGGTMPYSLPAALTYLGPAYLYIDATDPEAVYVTDSPSGLSTTARDYRFSSKVQYYLDLGTDLDMLKRTHPEYFGKLVDGNISFAAPGTLCWKVDASYKEANSSGKTSLALPGAKDYALNVRSGLCAPDGNVPVTIDAGEDVASMKCLFAPGFCEGNMELYRYYESIYAEKLIDITAGTHHFHPGENRRCSCLIFAYNADGRLVDGRCVAVYGRDQADEDWEALGEIDFKDVIIAPMYSSINPANYKVTIQRSKTENGYYRLVNPYGRAFLEANGLPDDGLCGHDHYIYINASDPSRVYLEESPIGLDLGYGGISVIGLPQYFLNYKKNPDDIETSGLFGTLREGVITLPARCILFCETMYKDNEWQETDPDGEFIVDLNAIASVQDIEVSDEVDIHYYNLLGIPVDNPSPGQVLIRRGNGKTTKIIVR